MNTLQKHFYYQLPNELPNAEAEKIAKDMANKILLKIDDYLHDLGLTSVADEMHKHPKSGSDYSLRSLLEKFVSYTND